MNSHLLTVLTLLPVVGGIATLVAGRGGAKLARAIAVAFALASVVLVADLWIGFNPHAGLQFEERWAWMPSFGVDYHLAVDGLSLPMLALSSLVVLFALVASGASTTPFYWSLMLFLESALFGVFTALNFVHWFLFWELSLIPAFFLIRFDGRTAQTKAALQFVLYTMTGSIAMLLAFIALFTATRSFDFIDLAGQGASALTAAQVPAGLIFLGVLIGLAVKVPLMPLHAWLPATYAEAPASTTMILTGALSKMGLYGFLRILLPIFPAQMREWSTALLWIAVATVVLPAAAAFAQKDLKRMIAYSSINHLGYCALGIFAAVKLSGAASATFDGQTAVLNGVVLQMFNHGLTAACLFYFVGLIEERGGGLRGLSDFGGLRRVAPVFAGLMGIAVFASVGLPGLNGFVGEFLIFKGVFALVAWAAVAAVPGLLITAIFLLTLWRRVWHGPLLPQWNGWRELTTRELWIAVPAIAGMFALGLFPQLIVGMANPAVMQLINHFNP